MKNRSGLDEQIHVTNKNNISEIKFPRQSNFI